MLILNGEQLNEQFESTSMELRVYTMSNARR